MNGNGFDPRRDDVLDDPFAWYVWLRKQPRAYLVENGGYYAVSHYDDVVTVTKEHGTFSSTGGVGLVWASHPMMSMYDPPEHARLRRIVASAFTPRTVHSLRPTMAQETERLLRELSTREHFDFVTDFAEPLVATVIADLIGLPRELVPRFRVWSLAITAMLAGNLTAEQGEHERRELVRAMRDAKGRDEGLLRVLSDASNAERLNDKELTAFCVLLLVAGFETTVNGMSNGAFALSSHCQVYQALRADRTLIPRCVDEILRLDPPVHAFFRNTLHPWTFPDGSTIPEGKKVMVLFASANHDDAMFENPEVLDLTRKNGSRHVAFGNGVHYCIGAPLASSLYDVVLNHFLDQGARLVLRGDAKRTRNSMLRGFQAMPVELSTL